MIGERKRKRKKGRQQRKGVLTNEERKEIASKKKLGHRPRGKSSESFLRRAEREETHGSKSSKLRRRSPNSRVSDSGAAEATEKGSSGTEPNQSLLRFSAQKAEEYEEITPIVSGAKEEKANVSWRRKKKLGNLLDSESLTWRVKKKAAMKPKIGRRSETERNIRRRTHHQKGARS